MYNEKTDAAKLYAISGYNLKLGASGSGSDKGSFRSNIIKNIDLGTAKGQAHAKLVLHPDLQPKAGNDLGETAILLVNNAIGEKPFEEQDERERRETAKQLNIVMGSTKGTEGGDIHSTPDRQHTSIIESDRISKGRQFDTGVCTTDGKKIRFHVLTQDELNSMKISSTDLLSDMDDPNSDVLEYDVLDYVHGGHNTGFMTGIKQKTWRFFGKTLGGDHPLGEDMLKFQGALEAVQNNVIRMQSGAQISAWEVRMFHQLFAISGTKNM